MYICECDVAGCSEQDQVKSDLDGKPIGPPKGWTVVDIAFDEVKIAGSAMELRRHLKMCPKHALPDFKPEPR